MEQTTESDADESTSETPKAIRYNVPQSGNPFGDAENYTLHTNGVTIYFDSIESKLSGVIFLKNGVEVAYVPNHECDVSPQTAKKYAQDNAGKKIRFSDD